MTVEHKIEQAVDVAMDEIHDTFWIIRENYDPQMTPEQFAQKVFARLQTSLDNMTQVWNDEIYDEEADDDA